MTLIDRLRSMPPGASVSVAWLLDELVGGTCPDLTVEALALRFGKQPVTIRAWLGKGVFPNAYHFRGRQWRVPLLDVEAFESREREGGHHEGQNDSTTIGQTVLERLTAASAPRRRLRRSTTTDRSIS